MSLANKYRPRLFSDVVGQEHIVDILKAHIQKGGTHTNYLFFGPRGTGKTTCARLLAKALNCQNPQNGNPCNECESCRIIDQGKSLDIVEIDAASHTGVDTIRSEIIDKAGYAPAQLKMKIYIIDEVHMLSKGAFNALLKIMEEPGDNVRFILATTEIHKVIDTIISRCQVFNFKRIGQEGVINRLDDIAKKEELTASTGALQLIAQMSEGCMRDAIKYLDQVSILGDISEQNVIKFLGVASDTMIAGFIQTLLTAKQTQDAGAMMTTLEEINQQGIDIVQFTKQVLGYIDKNLMEDIENMSQLAQVFSDIITQIKRYPQPILLYKTTLYHYIMGRQTNAGEITKASTSPKEKKVQKEEVNTQAKVQTQNQTQAKTDQHTQTQSGATANMEQLTQDFIAAINKPSLQKMFYDQSKFTGITGNMIDMIIINPMAKMQIKKQDIITYLEGLLHIITGKELHINFIIQTKEEFMSNQLLGEL